MIKKQDRDMADWYRVIFNRLIQMTRYTTSKYSRSKVRKAMPPDFAYIMEEMINTRGINKEAYYDNIAWTPCTLWGIFSTGAPTRT